MLTAVVADLHLGARMSAVATPPVRERLLAELDHCDQVVLLGDVLSLRDGALAEVLQAADPFLAGLREVAAGKRVWVVPGNHDHVLARSVLDAFPGGELGLENVTSPGDTGVSGEIARRLDGVDLAIAYPGLWIGPDVYATHGHYLDCHMTVPRMDCVVAALSAAALGMPRSALASPRDYEAVLAPMYAFSYEHAQASAALDGSASGRFAALRDALWDFGSRRISEASGARGLLSRTLVAAGVAGGLASMNLAGIASFKLDLTPEAIARAGVRAAIAMVSQLRIPARHVIFGHTHRAGPLEGEDWEVPGCPALVNAGGWVYSSLMRADRDPGGPNWPGRCVLVRDGGSPELHSVLDGQAAARLAR